MASWIAYTPLVPLICYIAYWVLPTKRKTQFSFAVGDASQGETVPRRNHMRKELVDGDNGCKTLYQSIKRASEVHADKPCLGLRHTIREVVKEKVDSNGNKKSWTYYERGSFEWLNYKQTFEIIEEFASGLRALGLNPVSFIFFLFLFFFFFFHFFLIFIFFLER